MNDNQDWLSKAVTIHDCYRWMDLIKEPSRVLDKDALVDLYALVSVLFGFLLLLLLLRLVFLLGFLGHAALAELEPDVTWLGEKTGQNDRLIGSTLAMKIGTERYALTVAIDNSGDLYGLQAIIRGVAEHLVETGPLVGSDGDGSR